jgi:hypothetical protein
MWCVTLLYTLTHLRALCAAADARHVIIWVGSGAVYELPEHRLAVLAEQHPFRHANICRPVSDSVPEC